MWRYIKEGESLLPFEYWSWAISEHRIIKSEDYAQAAISDKFMLSVCNKLYCKDIVSSVRFIEGRNNEDSRFLFDLADIVEEKQAIMLELTDILYYYQATPNSIYNTPTVPLEIDILKNLKDIHDKWYNRRRNLCDNIKAKYVAFLITLNGKIQETEKYHGYFKEYHNKLHVVPDHYARSHFGKRRYGAFLVLKYAPCLWRISWIKKYLTE